MTERISPETETAPDSALNEALRAKGENLRNTIDARIASGEVRVPEPISDETYRRMIDATKARAQATIDELEERIAKTATQADVDDPNHEAEEVLVQYDMASIELQKQDARATIAQCDDWLAQFESGSRVRKAPT